MTYRERLNDLITKSGMTNKEVAEKCSELGVDITANYIGILRTQDKKIASDEVSMAIAEICNAEYKEILVVHAGLERAPSVINEFVERFHDNTVGFAKTAFEKIYANVPEQLRDQMKANFDKNLPQIDKATFVCEFMRGMYDDANKVLLDQLELITPTKKKWALIPINSATDVTVLESDEIVIK